MAVTADPGATATLYDGTPDVSGPNDRVRGRRLPKTVTKVNEAIKSQLERALPLLPGNRTDTAAATIAAGDILIQRPGPAHVVFLHDAITNTGRGNVNISTLTAASALKAARSTPVGNLSGATVTFTGVGRTAPPAPPSDYVYALRVYAHELCVRTKAASCTVVTETVTP